MKKSKTATKGTPKKQKPYVKKYEGQQNTTYRNSEVEATPEARRTQMKKKSKLTKAQILRNKRRRQRRFIGRLFVVMAATALSVWGLISIKEWLTKPKVSTQIVKEGYIDTSKTLEGIIIRDEKIYYSQEEGQVQYNVSEGDKVKKDGIVYALVDHEQLALTEKEKEQVDTEIHQAADKRKEISYYQDEVYSLNTDFKAKMDDFYNGIYSTTTDYIYALRTQLEENIDKRTSLYVQEQTDLGVDFDEKINSISSDLSVYKQVKKAQESGIVSYKMDGQENVDFESIESLDYKTYQKIAKESDYTSMMQSHLDKEVPAYKLVVSNKWYIVSFIEGEDAESFDIGESYRLNFDSLNKGNITCKLLSKEEEDKKVRLVFEADTQVSDFLEVRKVQFSMGNKEETGLKIPLQAVIEQSMLKVPTDYIIEKDNMTGVYRKKGEITEFVSIVPQYEKQDNIYILQDVSQLNALRVNDIIVHPIEQNSYTLSEVETTQGVYVINGKIVKFKQVEVFAQNDEYAIIKNNGNNKLKEKDKIISNPKRIKVDQQLEEMNIQNE